MTLKLITLNQWLNLFIKKEKVNFKTFLETSKVKKSNGEIVYLIEYCRLKKINRKQIRIIYDFTVTNKEIYLKNFYKTSLEVHIDSDFSNFDTLPISYNNVVNRKSKNIIRNIFLKEILGNTGTIQPNIRTYLEVIDDLFNKFIIDYKLLSPSFLDILLYRGVNISSILSGVYFRASIMNPFLVYNIFKYNFREKKKVFTPTLGWGSYVTGLSQFQDVKEYVGVDVIPRVCNMTKAIAKELNPNLKVDIFCEPSEGLIKKSSFLKNYKNYFDVIFFSPPYYEYELYEGSKQSTKKYKTYDEWLQKYWLPTIKLCRLLIKNNGRMCYIISKYKVNNKIIDLPKDMNKITKLYFESEGIINMENSNVKITKHRDTAEIVFFWKPK
tara:strand:- start:2216 stop:3364 length:1149 start_codon:yes stop_codon:yes gene_type:complete